MISVAEFQAGERLRADFHFAGLGQRVTARWDREVQSSAGRGDHLSDRAYDARDRYHRALAAVGPELSGILVDVCCFLKGIGEIERTSGWPERSAKVVLRLALSRLARHYGLLPPTPPREGTIRNWRAGDAPG